MNVGAGAGKFSISLWNHLETAKNGEKKTKKTSTHLADAIKHSR